MKNIYHWYHQQNLITLQNLNITFFLIINLCNSGEINYVEIQDNTSLITASPDD